MQIFSILFVDFLLNRNLSPGIYIIEWNPQEHNGHSIPRGVYFCLIKAEGVKQVKKILLLK